MKGTITMAYGHELFLGFRGLKDIGEAATALDIKVFINEGEIEPEDTYKQINERLQKAWHDAIVDIGLEIIRETTLNRHISFLIKTPVGEREMVPWSLELQYDPHECGDEPEDAILGVSLISRYYPTYLDWREEHGGSGLVISLDANTLWAIERAKFHIKNVYPIFGKADIHAKEIFY